MGALPKNVGRIKQVKHTQCWVATDIGNRVRTALP